MQQVSEYKQVEKTLAILHSKPYFEGKGREEEHSEKYFTISSVNIQYLLYCSLDITCNDFFCLAFYLK